MTNNLMNIKSEVGKLVKNARKHKSLSIGKKFTQKDLALAINKSQGYIGDIESGRSNANFEILNDIAKACDLSIDYFSINPEVSDFLQSEKNNRNLELLKSEKNNKKKADIINDLINFTNPQDAMKFILSQPTIMGFGGFNINEMTDTDVIHFANDLLNQLKLLSYKYKK